MKTLKKITLFLSCGLLVTQISFAQIRQELLKSIHSDRVSLFTVWDGNRKLGSSLWINRTENSEIKAQYFADKMVYSSIYDRYNSWKNGKKIIALCSGAFTDDYTKPKGITIDYGTIINRNIDIKMNGLVIVYPTGGIVVSDISKGDLKIGNNNSSLNIRNEYDKQKFLTFAQNEKLTAFQTQLLVFNNVLQCKANKELRERRFLVIAKGKNNEILHIIFDIPESVYLLDTAQKILDFFKNSGRTIIGMLNLDTGSYNMINVYDAAGKKVPEFKGSYDILGAINLVTYYY
ncbi:MAG: hypothetical protein LBN27_08100 [Prevotellaceae bacterium]|jgi:hypothetical protein|nr:hypothetical protein [Prevotellaceae bacterium]